MGQVVVGQWRSVVPNGGDIGGGGCYLVVMVEVVMEGGGGEAGGVGVGGVT